MFKDDTALCRFSNQDFFDVSVTDGFNVAVGIETDSTCKFSIRLGTLVAV